MNRSAAQGTWGWVAAVAVISAQVFHPAAVLADADSNESEVEEVVLDPQLPQLLLTLSDDQTLSVTAWPAAPGKRLDIVLSRREVYAPDAKIYKVDGDRTTELPRSSALFFAGHTSDGQASVMISIEPGNQEIHGLAQLAEGLYELRGEGGSGNASVGRARGSDPSAPQAPPAFSCDSDLSHPKEAPLFAVEALAAAPTALTQEHTATIAIDTDNEFMLNKFSNNTVSATSYIAGLFAAMNVMYERDLLVRLLQGTTFLRVSTTPDPYSTNPPADAYCMPSSSGAADCPRLREFTNYWAAGCGGACTGAPRALVAMLSGKQPAGGSSGLAWVDGLCSTSYGYSFSQVIPSAGDTSTWDASSVGHEIGHNFGSAHTHCYAPAIDGCSSGESGCYDGPPICPAQATYNGVTASGTMMGYCHQLVGCSTAMVFHPTVVAHLEAILASHTPAVAGAAACILPLPLPATGFYTLPPCRVVDTTGLAGPLGAPELQPGQFRTFNLTLGACGVPATAKAVAGNVTVVGPAAAGNMSLYPGNLAPQGTPTVHFRPGQTISNNVVLMLATNGLATIGVENASSGKVDMLFDVSGYFR